MESVATILLDCASRTVRMRNVIVAFSTSSRGKATTWWVRRKEGEKKEGERIIIVVLFTSTRRKATNQRLPMIEGEADERRWRVRVASG